MNRNFDQAGREPQNFSDATRREEERRRREREEDAVVRKLMDDRRKVVVVAHTRVQFDLFQRKFFQACERMGLRIVSTDCVRMEPQMLRGRSQATTVLVLLNSWERGNLDRQTRDEIDYWSVMYPKATLRT